MSEPQAAHWRTARQNCCPPYLGEKFLRPVVARKAFLTAFPNSYGKKSVQPKLIVKGLNLLDACLDAEGLIIPGKTTLMVTARDTKALKLLLALLNHPVSLFYRSGPG